MVTMGRRLRWVREARGESRVRIAEHIGVHQSAWAMYEKGERWPDQFSVVRIIAKLKISLAYLLEGCLQDVDRDLAIRLAASHPELVPPIDRAPHRGTGQS